MYISFIAILSLRYLFKIYYQINFQKIYKKFIKMYQKKI